MAQRPTTLNSMTHYALTEEQDEVMEQEDAETSLREALQRTPSDPSNTRTWSAVESGLLVPQIEMDRLMGRRPSEEEERDQQRRQQEEQSRQRDDQQRPQSETDQDDQNGAIWIISNGEEPARYWADDKGDWVDDVEEASLYDDAARGREALPEYPQTVKWIESSEAGRR